MSEAKHNILSRLKAVSVEPVVALQSDGVATEDWSRLERVERFRQRMEAVRAEVYECHKDDWLNKLADICAEKKLHNLLVSNQNEIGKAVYQSTEALPELREYENVVEDWKNDLFNEVDASLTSSRCGIAETGTLVLWPGPYEPRLMSLVPPVHIAVLEVDTLYTTFAEVVAAEGWGEKGMPTNALLISGPSKSADIEQTLAYGVHGPKELIVILIN